MFIETPYGAETIRIKLPTGQSRWRTRRAAGGAVKDLQATVRRGAFLAARHARVRELVKPSSRVLIAFDDPTVSPDGPPIRGTVLKR